MDNHSEYTTNQLEPIEHLKFFNDNEIREIAKKRQQYDYKIHKHTKGKEDYLRYIQYEMDLLKLVKQRRKKFIETASHDHLEIEYSIANKINKLYIQAIFRFKTDIRFWVAYMKFCKHVHFYRNMNTLINQMVQIHYDKPKCWYIVARWEIEENNNVQRTREFLLRGLHFHPESQLLFIEVFKLELKEATSIEKNIETSDCITKPSNTIKNEMSLSLNRASVIYQQASRRIKDVVFVIKLLNIAKDYPGTEQLQNLIISTMIQDYAHKPEMWDTMARRQLEGLTYESEQDNTIGEFSEPNITISYRDRINDCIEVYQTAVKKIKSEVMWSLYIDCLLEINQDLAILPNYKRKLLKSGLTQAHQAKKLPEKYYFHWIDILKNDKRDESSQNKLYEILNDATEALPTSIHLWHEKLEYLIISDRDELTKSEFEKGIKILDKKSLPLWRMKLMYTQMKNPANVEDIFRTAIQEDPEISRVMKPAYIEWLVLVKGIQWARQIYSNISVQPQFCLELHKKMAALELIQPEISMFHARRPHETAIVQFGKQNTDVWINYIIFEMKYGDQSKIENIHRRAMATLDVSFSDCFFSEYSLIKANSESIESSI